VPTSPPAPGRARFRGAGCPSVGSFRVASSVVRVNRLAARMPQTSDDIEGWKEGVGDRLRGSYGCARIDETRCAPPTQLILFASHNRLRADAAQARSGHVVRLTDDEAKGARSARERKVSTSHRVGSRRTVRRADPAHRRCSASPDSPQLGVSPEASYGVSRCVPGCISPMAAVTGRNLVEGPGDGWHPATDAQT